MVNAKELAKFAKSLTPTIPSKAWCYVLVAQNLFIPPHQRLVQEVNHLDITVLALNVKVNINRLKLM
jgi:hypothetical protein